MKTLWYAVQKETNDTWDYGSYDKGEATKMLLNNDDYKLLAVINVSTENPVCVEEIWKEDLDTTKDFYDKIKNHNVSLEDFIRLPLVDKITSAIGYAGKNCWEINMSGIYDALIKEASKCKHYSSDILYDINGINQDLKTYDYEGGCYLFGFREMGVDHDKFIISRLTSSCYRSLKEYTSIYRLMLDVNDGEILATLDKIY